MREAAAAPEAHREALEYIERVTAGAGQVQRRVLAEILVQNMPAEYLCRLGVAGDAPGAAEAFLPAAPLVTYEDILQDVLHRQWRHLAHPLRQAHPRVPHQVRCSSAGPPSIDEDTW